MINPLVSFYLAGTVIFSTLPVHAGLQEGIDAFERGDYGFAFEQLAPLARRGDSEAQLMLGLMYLRGKGVVPNPTLAKKYIQKSANQGNAKAMEFLKSATNNYFEKFSSAVNPFDASGGQFTAGKVDRIEKQAAQGDAESQYVLAQMHYYGAGVNQSYRQSAEWYKLASDQGHGEAMYNLSLMYAVGKGVEQNTDKFLSLLKAAARLGVPEARQTLIELIERAAASEQ